MKQGTIRCDLCVYWKMVSTLPIEAERVAEGLSKGACHLNPATRIKMGADWCSHFRSMAEVLSNPDPNPHPVKRTRPLTGAEMLDMIVASLRDYPDIGGDVEVGAEVDRIVKEAVEKDRAKRRTPCQHKDSVLYCSNCCKINIHTLTGSRYRIRVFPKSSNKACAVLTAVADPERVDRSPEPVREPSCAYGHTGCNCDNDPGDRG